MARHRHLGSDSQLLFYVLQKRRYPLGQVYSDIRRTAALYFKFHPGVLTSDQRPCSSLNLQGLWPLKTKKVGFCECE